MTQNVCESDLATTLRHASLEELESVRLVCEIEEVLLAITEATTRSKYLRRKLQYKITHKKARITASISNLPDVGDAEWKLIHPFLAKLNAGSVDFWNPNVQNHFSNAHIEYLRATGYMCIALCFVLETSGIHQQILRRFTRVAVYMLTLNGRRTARTIAEDCKNAGVSFNHDPTTLTEDIEGFVRAGNRYYGIANILGGFGSLFFLPGIDRSIYELHLPKSGQDNKAFLEQLIKMRIMEVSQPHHALADEQFKQGLDSIQLVARSETLWCTQAPRSMRMR